MKGWMILFLLITQLFFPNTPIVQANTSTDVLAQKTGRNTVVSQIDYDKVQRDVFLKHIQQNVKATLARNSAPYKFPANNSATVTTSADLITKSVSTSFPQLNAIDSDFADDCSYCITKENLFFPKASNADLAFQATSVSGTLTFSIIRSKDVNGNYIDPYNRILEVWTDGSLAFSTVVSGDRTISVAGLDPLVVVIRLRWGGYTNYAWSIKKVYFSNSNDFALANNVFFSSSPTTLAQQLTFAFIGGEATELILTAKSLEGNTGSGAGLQFYIDGVFYPPSSLYSTNGILTFSGIFPNTWGDRSIHYITVELTSFSGESWYIESMGISYLALRVYYYWHPENELSSSSVSYIENYYKQNGYERIDLIRGHEITMYDNEVIDNNKLDDLYDKYGPADYDTKSRAAFLVDTTGGELGGFARYGESSVTHTGYFFPYFVVAVQSLNNIPTCIYVNYYIISYYLCQSNENKIQAVFMHELGHSLGILKKHYSAEYYDWGNRDSSVMNELTYYNAINSPYYSKWYWTGEGKWWETRQGFQTVATPYITYANFPSISVSTHSVQVDLNEIYI